MSTVALAFRRRRRARQTSPFVRQFATSAVVIAAVGFTALSAQASSTALAEPVTINFVGQVGHRNVLAFDGSTIAEESGEVRVGIVAPTFDYDQHADDFQRLREAFTTLGVSPIRNVQGEESRFSDTTSFSDEGTGGGKLFLWVLKTSDGEPVEEDDSNVAEYALYSSSSSHWVVPDGKALPPGNRTIINSSEIDEEWGQGTATDAPTPGSLFMAPLQAPVFSYPLFAASTFPDDAPVDLTGPADDYDKDGIVNAVEWFTGNNVLVADASPFRYSFEDGEITVTFNRSEDVDAGLGSVNVSEDLKGWLATEGDYEVLSEVGSIEEVQTTVSVSDFDMIYLRFGVK